MLLATADWPSPIEAPKTQECLSVYEHSNKPSVHHVATGHQVGPGTPGEGWLSVYLPANTLLTEECVARPGCPLSWKIPA